MNPPLDAIRSTYCACANAMWQLKWRELNNCMSVNTVMAFNILYYCACVHVHASSVRRYFCRSVFLPSFLAGSSGSLQACIILDYIYTYHHARRCVIATDGARLSRLCYCASRGPRVAPIVGLHRRSEPPSSTREHFGRSRIAER